MCPFPPFMIHVKAACGDTAGEQEGGKERRMEEWKLKQIPIREQPRHLRPTMKTYLESEGKKRGLLPTITTLS